MAANYPADPVPPVDDTISRRDLAVARSLDSARLRAEKRVQRFLDAGFELLNGSPSSKEFTVQEVVERSGQSLRSFYQYFAGKYELLLALFEESVRFTADHLRELISGEDEPVERLHLFVVEYYRLCRPARRGRSAKKGPTPAMAEFAQQLLTTHPQEASKAFVPLVSLFMEVLEGAAEAGAIRSDVQLATMAGVVLQGIMFNAFATAISGSAARPGANEAPEEFWQLLFHGIAAGATS